jgi:hypothetical protein
MRWKDRNDQVTMKSLFYIPAESPEEWRRLLADPEKHWVSGYSARTLAYCWQDADGFPESVRQAFICSKIPVFQNITALMSFPEHQVPLPGGIRPTQTDLWVLARSGFHSG